MRQSRGSVLTLVGVAFVVSCAGALPVQGVVTYQFAAACMIHRRVVR